MSEFYGDRVAFQTRLAEVVRLRSNPVAGAKITYALVDPEPNKPAFVTCRWEFFDAPQVTRSSVRYGSLLLGEKWFAGEESISRLHALLGGESAVLGVPEIGGAFGQVRGDWSVPGDATPFDTLSGWPEWVFKASHDTGGNQPRVPHRATAGFGLRPYSSGLTAITHWVWPESQRLGASDVRHSQEVVVILPDTRARLASVRWEGADVEALVEANVPSAELEVQLVADLGNGVFASLPSQVGVRDVRWSAPSEAKRCEVYLVHQTVGLLGIVFLSPQREVRGGRASDRSAEENTKIELASGESETIEFKPFIRPNDPKEEELVNSIVAFSNSAGGRIYVGARKDGVPEPQSVLLRIANKGKAKEGNEDEFDPPKNLTPDIALGVLKSRIDFLVHERIKPVPAVTVDVARPFGESVLVINVPRGSDRPYSTHEHVVWIRKGATNRRPDPKTELPGLYPKAEANLFDYD